MTVRDQQSCSHIILYLFLELGKIFLQVDVEVFFLNILGNDAVKRVPHLMGDAGIYHFESLILQLLVVIQDRLRDVYELYKNLFFVFNIKSFQPNLKIVVTLIFYNFRIGAMKHMKDLIP